MVEAVMARDLVQAKVMDPDIPAQHMTPRRAFSMLKEVRLELVKAGERTVEVVTRRTGAQARVLKALGVDTSPWDKASVA